MASSIQPYQISNQYNDAENYAFSFAKNEKKCERKSDTKQRIIEERLGGSISPTWILMSIIFIVAGIGLGLYAAFNAELALAGIVDPQGNGTIPTIVLRMIGISISIIGMLIGHEIYESFRNTERDPITGSRSNYSRSVLLIIAALIYIGFQVILVLTAGSGIEDSDAGLNNLAFVILGIALLELLVGAFFLNKAIAYLFLSALTIILMWLMFRMNRSAKLTNSAYRIYLSLLDSYNRNNSIQLDREGNNNIRRAIGYYLGIQDKQNNETKDHDDNEKEVIPVTENQPKPVIPNNGNGAANNINTRNNHHEDLESFIDDNIDDDLTM